MRVLIGIPTAGSPTAPFLAALRELQVPPQITSLERLVWSGNFVPGQREMIAREAVRRDDDLLVMFDDDVVPPPDTLARLLSALADAPRAAVAGALYYSRDSARPMAVTRWRSTDTTTAAIPAFRDGEVVSVDGVGFGCVALRVEALRALDIPYFATHIFIDTASRSVRQCDEDYLYCERVRTAGWQVLLHAGIRLPHYDRGTQKTAPERWETDAETGRQRMIVREGDAVRLVAFDDRVPRVQERQQPFPATYLLGSD